MNLLYNMKMNVVILVIHLEIMIPRIMMICGMNFMNENQIGMMT